ncbi:MAG: hypothetical protein L0099_05955, partial [Acidobacteria bacterium]|nr:hypothetical protein [Acidobacteriota bacterium]
IEASHKGKPPIEQYDAWQAAAKEQIQADPLGQMALCVRKAIRFWTYLPPHSWTPSWKTAGFALVALPLALVGFWSRRRESLAQLCLLGVFGLWAFHALIHAELRYNFPILPLLDMLVVFGMLQVMGPRAPRAAAADVPPFDKQ